MLFQLFGTGDLSSTFFYILTASVFAFVVIYLLIYAFRTMQRTNKYLDEREKERKLAKDNA